jgi:hypothetical protein
MHIENISIRAHKVSKMEYAPYSTFNCWHDNKLFDFLMNSDRTHDGLNMDGLGMIEVSVGRIQEALASQDLNLDNDVRESLESDIAWAKGREKDYISYDCF